ncbi:response regulator transcription factor [Paenibacillus sp. UNC496MF]|uniref:response regulator n=1 Tax=Paenibacillus sp. UNC496MF TaxID=1502753 RepID=UPI0015A52A27|nr:response regulator transcription factor [Paenibacillus sp. UNC496MF]
MKTAVNSIKVLIVDGSEQTRNKLALTMANNPAIVLVGSVGSGYEAVTFAANNAPDVAVMDIEIESRLAGLYAMREIIKLRPNTKIIIYTVQNSDYYISNAFLFGASDYLIKGVSEPDLPDTIIRAAQNRCIIHPEAADYLRKEYIQLKNTQENLAYTIRVILKLTPSEMEILHLLRSGMNYKEVAEVRFTEMTTLKTHISNLLRKFDKKSVVEMLETIEHTGFFSLIDSSK